MDCCKCGMKLGSAAVFAVLCLSVASGAVVSVTGGELPTNRQQLGLFLSSFSSSMSAEMSAEVGGAPGEANGAGGEEDGGEEAPERSKRHVLPSQLIGGNVGGHVTNLEGLLGRPIGGFGHIVLTVNGTNYTILGSLSSSLSFSSSMSGSNELLHHLLYHNNANNTNLNMNIPLLALLRGKREAREAKRRNARATNANNALTRNARSTNAKNALTANTNADDAEQRQRRAAEHKNDAINRNTDDVMVNGERQKRHPHYQLFGGDQPVIVSRVKGLLDLPMNVSGIFFGSSDSSMESEEYAHRITTTATTTATTTRPPPLLTAECCATNTNANRVCMTFQKIFEACVSSTQLGNASCMASLWDICDKFVAQVG